MKKSLFTQLIFYDFTMFSFKINHSNTSISIIIDDNISFYFWSVALQDSSVSGTKGQYQYVSYIYINITFI